MGGLQLKDILQQAFVSHVNPGASQKVVRLNPVKLAPDTGKAQQGRQLGSKGKAAVFRLCPIKRFDAEKISGAQQGAFPRIMKGKGKGPNKTGQAGRPPVGEGL